MAGEVSLQTTLNHTAIQTLNSSQLIYVLMEIQPTGIGVPTQHMPLNFGLVLDRSGSMAGSKLENLQEAVRLILSSMSPQDLVSIVLFDDKVETLVQSQPVSDLNYLYGQVAQITDRGGTNISKGIRQGLTEIRKGSSPERLNRILLLTDGDTYGDEAQCLQLASECGQEAVPIYAFGLGDEWNADLLDTIGRNSTGDSGFMDSPDKIMVGFQQTLQSMQKTVATNANLTLRLVSGVTPRAAWRVVPQISKLDTRNLSDRDVQLYLGELESGTGQSILVELVVQPKAVGTYRIAQAEVSYDIPSTGVIGERTRQDLILTYTDNPAQIPPPNPEIMNLIEKVSVFKLQTRALTEAQAGNVAMATQQLRVAATRLLNMGEADLAQAAQEEAANLEQQGSMSAMGTKKLQYETRKLTQRLDEMVPST